MSQKLGRLGTIEEFFEMLTWTQLGIHQKPCGLLNVAGYFDPLLAFLSRAAEHKFIREEHRAMVLAHQKPEHLLELFGSYRQPQVDKAEWILSMSANQTV